ncbi:LCP family protein [Streptomyces sp. TP-A0874]|uniref:LCP family protein n=1 Tax=Streptomyces sp. TP-A0874 TaxID=549819 RepID=UPI0009A0476E|nr:LCP family protein [Streptomyces sp. TP-A0874]
MTDESSDPGPDRPSEDGAATGGSGALRRGGPRRKAVLVVVCVLAGLLLIGGAGFAVLWFRLDGNLKGIDINGALGTDRPEDADDGSTDILILGSDSRAGANGAYGHDGESGARSDTAMVLHVYPDRKRASVVSIPRDTIVERPSCEKRGGGTAPPARGVMFNEAYRLGGPVCAVKTVEALSDIRMDHYLEVDFTGFKKLIDKLGGVKVTTHQAINDRDSRLDLEPGTHRLDGEQALGLVRTRHSVGDGSDLGRIRLQQAFMKALISQIKQIDLFGDPARMYGLASTATKTLTTDSELASVEDLLGFGRTLKGIDARNTEMVTLPVRYDPEDANRVLPLAKQSRQVWDALRHDRPIPASATRHPAGERAEKETGGVVGGEVGRGGAGPERAGDPADRAGKPPE